MVNRSNYVLSNKYLTYRKEIDQLSKGSMRFEKTQIRRLLEWAGDVPFAKIMDKRPSYPEYLLAYRLDRRDGELKHDYRKRLLATARRFFYWLYEGERGYRHIRPTWIKTLKTKRAVVDKGKIEAVTFEEIIAIVNTLAETLKERRTKAAACFLYLSGERISAFVSMPIKAVDIKNRMILQHPDLGVKTKNRRHATTYLLPIPELIEIVEDWDKLVRSVLPENGFWFAPFTPDTGEIDTDCFEIGDSRPDLARKNLKAWMKKNDLPYRSPHKFRHGHIHYGLENAKDLEQFKAVSMNVMHSNMTITDQIYSRLKDDTVNQNIEKLGKSNSKKPSIEDNIEQIQEFLEFLHWKKNQGN